MTEAGKINKNWYDNALCNGSHGDIEQWFARYTNTDVEIDENLRVWSGDPRGCWLSQERIDDICKALEK